MATLNIKVAIDENIVKQKVDNLIDDSIMLDIHKLFAEMIDPWTPYLSGNLSEDITIAPDGITYNAPYSGEKYFGYAYHKEVHPLATSHWAEVALDQGVKETFELKVQDMLIQKAKELYG